MSDVEKLTLEELKIIHNGLMEIGYRNYYKNERELIHTMKEDIRSAVIKHYTTGAENEEPNDQYKKVLEYLGLI